MHILHWSSPLTLFDVRSKHAKERNVKDSLNKDEVFVFSVEAKGMQEATVLYSPGYQFVLASKREKYILNYYCNQFIHSEKNKIT